MAVTSKNLRSEQQARQVVSPLRERFHIAAYSITLLLAAVALYALVGLLIGRASVFVDDLRYGRPRTFQVDAHVNHDEASGMPTHLMALNLNRQVVIVELPGGDPAKARTITGPYLFGANEDLTPVTLDLDDIDGDGQLDLLVDVRQEQIVYLNRDGAFRLPTAEEQAQLKLESRT